MQLNFILNNSSPDDLSCHLQDSVLSKEGVYLFQNLIYNYYQSYGRTFAWRNVDNPYYVVVSELMLQQTQTERVREKYQEFIEQFTNVQALAEAPVHHVISAWQGLGYNRRALALHEFANKVVTHYNSQIPQNPEILQTFKGIGPYTAASICAFAFNKPTIFIETNIRAVFIHCFFRTKQLIKDKDIMPLVAQTLDCEQPRSWYYPLMDAGVIIKKIHKNPSRKSAHYTVQSKFEGSNRQLRGLIIKLLVEYTLLSAQDFTNYIKREPQDILGILKTLEKEGFIIQQAGKYSLS